MQIIQISGTRTSLLIEKPDPTVSGFWAIVKIHSAPMCTEFKMYDSGQESSCLGHEASGEVAAAGPEARVKKGDRVVVQPLYSCGVCDMCRSGFTIHCEHQLSPKDIAGAESVCGTYAQYIVKPHHLLSPLPDDISFDHGAMACCALGPTFGAMERMSVNASDTVLIAGLGPVGLGGIINAVHRGARVVCIEPNPYRARLAMDLGASLVINPDDSDPATKVREFTGGNGADKAVECSGIGAAQRTLIDSVRRRGSLAFVGESGELTINIGADMIRKGLTLYGSWHYNILDYPKIMDVIRRNTKKLDMLVTHRFPMRKAEEAWKVQLEGKCGKIILHPWKEHDV